MEKSRYPSVATAAVVLMTAVWLMSLPAMVCPAADGKLCSNCIRDRLKLDCPACAPPLRCMAQCLWGGAPRSRCVKRCDCGGAWPRLSTCRRCMSRCKCSCGLSSSSTLKV